MKYSRFYLIAFLFCTTLSCFNVTRKKEPLLGYCLQDKIKEEIHKICVDSFLNKHIFKVSILKLNTESIINISPINSKQFIKNSGIPYLYYEYGSSLYLVYNGMENIVMGDSTYNNTVEFMFSEKCLKFGIKDTGNLINDYPLVFMKIQGDSLIKYDKGYQKDFFLIFYGVNEDTGKYIPPKILL